MYREASLAALLLLAATVACAAAAGKPDPRIVYAPDVVGVDRLFLVVLKAPADAPDVAVTLPDGVAMLDHTRPPAKDDTRRFYFRASKPAKAAEIRFALPGGDVVVPVEVWSFEDLRQYRMLKGVQLPRRWPLGKPLPELKEKQTLTTEVEKAALKGKPGGAPQWLNRSDEEIWAMQPDSTIPRWHWVNIQFGCPVHGTEIYKKKAYYPWIKDATPPWSWKIKCPVGGETYPSNDISKGDFTSGAFPDDGIGGGFVKDGKHYGFLAELAQFYDHQALRVAPDCAQGYLATGDVRYVHKALVAMSRIAVEHAYLATMTQHRHRNNVGQVDRLGQGRFDEGPCLAHAGLTVYPIDQPSYQAGYAEAYDRIWPAIEQDPEIIPFLRGKGFDIKTHEDVRRFLEENLFATWMQAAMDGATHSNEPYHQWGLAKMAEMLNYKAGTDFMDWLYDGEGRMRVFATNAFFRDGAPYESTGGYNGMHVVAFGPIVDAVEHLRALRPDVYTEERYPALSKSRRYRSVFDFDMETVTIDRSYPYIGDTGSWPAYAPLQQKITWQGGGAGAYEHAYRLFRDPKYAWALAGSPGWTPSEGFPFTREQVEREAAKQPANWNDRSALHDGYGIAILRGGQGDNKRAFWMRYGCARGHMQDDMLDIGLQGFQGILLSHMGYPRNWGYWEYSWTSHHLARQIPFQNMTAQAQTLADAGPVHLAEVRAQAYSNRVDAGEGYILPPDDWQRRMIALVDVGPEQFYCVDFYRISGGKEHWWAFHAQEGDFTTQGLSLAKQETGTLAGPNVPYGNAGWLKANGCGYGGYGWSGPMFGLAHLYNVLSAGADSTLGPWSADWALKSGNGLHLRLHVAESSGAEVKICDGTSPAGGKPYEMKWIMLHNKAEAPARTQVLSILEPYKGAPLIQEVRRLALSGADEAGFAAGGCVLRLAGRTDTVLASADPAVARTAEGGIRFAGRFGLYSERDGRPASMVLVGGTELSKGPFGIRMTQPEFHGKVTKTDRATETITVSPAPPVPAAMVGARIFLTSAVRRSAYKVLEAKAVPGGVQLRLDTDSRIGTGRVTGVEDLRVKTNTPFPLQSYRYYHGARRVNAARTAEYRIVEARHGKAAILDAVAHPEAKAAKLAPEFPNDTWFDIYDYGVGDEVVWPYAVSVTETSPNTYRVTAPAPVEVSLPAGAKREK